MVAFLLIIGIASALGFLTAEVKQLKARYRIEYRRSHGAHKVYLRSRKTGRLVYISANPFNLLLKGYDYES